MSRTIDERIVEMKFNNRDFERNVSTTMSTLDKLKEKLHLDGASKGIEEINKASRRFSLSNMASEADKVSLRFDAMSVAAMSAIQHIVDKAMTAGEKLVKSLSVDQIAAGWDKFSKKTTSVGTMIAQGYSQSEVDAELSRLLWFTDETSYDFSAMVDSISKFTASGRDLHGAVDALEGIALWAAKSGQNATTASGAMYQLAQAIARPMNRQDWISVMNANMDTEEFRKTAIQAAEEVGTLTKVRDGVWKAISTGKEVTVEGFIDSLSESDWMTGDVQIAAYQKYAAAVNDIYEYTNEKGVLAATAIRELEGEVDEFSRGAFKAGQETRTFADAIDATKDAVSSSWMTTFEYIFGNYTQATALWSDFVEKLYDTFAEPINARNELLGEALTSGIAQFVEETGVDSGLLEESLRKVVSVYNTEAKDAFSQSMSDMGADGNQYVQDMLNSFSGIDIDALIKEYGSFEDSLQSGWLTADMLAEAVHKSVEYFDELRAENPNIEFTEYVANMETAYRELDAQIQNNEVNLDSYIKKMSRPSGRYNLIEAFNTAWENASTIIASVKGALSNLFPSMTVDSIYNFTAKIRDLISSLTLSDKEALGLKNVLTGLMLPLKGVWSILKWISTQIGTIFSWSREQFKGFLNQMADIETFGDLLMLIFGNERYQRLAVAWSTITENMSNAYTKFKDAISNMLGQLGGAERLQSIWESIHSTLTGIADWSLEKIVQLVEFIAGINWDKIITPATKAIETISTWFIKLASYAGEGSVFSRLFTTIVTGIKDIAHGIGSILTVEKIENVFSIIFESLGSALSSIFSALTSAISSGEVHNVFDVILDLLSTGILLKLYNIIKSASNTFSEAISSIKDALSNLQGSVNDKAIKNIAIAIGILALSLVVLSSVDQSKLLGAIGSIALLMVILQEFVETLQDITSGTKFKDASIFKKFSSSLIRIAAGVLIMAIALKQIASIEPDTLGVSLLTLLAVVELLIHAIQQLSKKKFKASMGLGIVLLASSMLIFIGAMKMAAKLSWEDIAKGLTSIAGVLVLVLLAVKQLSKSGILKTSAGFILLGAAMAIFAGVMHSIAKLSWEDIAKGLVSFLAVLSSFALLLPSFDNTRMLKTSAGFILLGAAMAIFAGVMHSIAKLSWEDIAKGMVSLGASLAIIAIAIRFLEEHSIAKTGAGLLVLSVGLLALAGVMKILSTLSWEQLVIALVAIVGLLGAVGVAVVALAPFTTAMLALGASMLLIGSGIALIGAGLVMLGAGLAAIVGSGAAFVELIKLTFTTMLDLIPYFFTKIGEAILAFGQMVVDSKDALILIVETIIDILAKAIFNKIPELSTTLLSMISELLSQLNEYAPQIVRSLLDLLVSIFNELAASIPEIVSAVGSILSTIFDALIEAIGGLSVENVAEAIATLGAFAGIMALITVIAAEGLLATAMLPIIGNNLSAFIVAIEPFMSAIQNVDPAYIESAKNLAEMVLIFTAASFLDAIASFFGSPVDLVALGEQLNAFAPLLGQFADEVASHDFSNMENATLGARTLAEFVSVLPRSGGIMGTIFGEPGDLNAFSNSIVQFADGIVAFSQKMQQYGPIDESMVQNAANSGRILAELQASLPRTGGALQWLIGETDFDKFSSGIVAFADAIIQYDSKMSEYGSLHDGLIVASAIAGQVLAELNKSLPKTDGFWQVLSGKYNMQQFGRDMISFASAITAYDRILSKHGELNTDLINASATAGKALSELNASIPKTDGFWQLLSGEQDMEKFSTGITAFGHAIADYDTALKANGPIDQDLINGSVTAGLALVELQKQLEPIGGVVGFFEGDPDMDAFGNGLTALGNGLSDFYSAIKTVHFTVFDRATSGAESLVGIYNLLDTSGGLDSLLNGDKSFSIFGSTLGDLGSGLKDFYDYVVDVNWVRLDASITVLSNLMNLLTSYESMSTDWSYKFQQNLENVANAGIDVFSSAFSDRDITFVTIGGNIITKMLSGVEIEFPAFEEKVVGSVSHLLGEIKMVIAEQAFDVGQYLLRTIIQGILVSQTQAFFTLQVDDVVYTLISALKNSFGTKPFDIGVFVSKGLAAGMVGSESVLALTRATRKMCSVISNATDNELRIDSPSKVFEDKGEYTVLGYVKGVLGSMYLAKEAAEDLGTSTVDAMAAAVSYAYAAAISDYDFRPTISPILDLEDVRAEAASMRSMFDFMPAIKMAAETGDAVEAKVAQVRFDKAVLSDSITGLRNDISRIKVRVADTPNNQPDLEGAIERGFSKVSVNMDGRKVGKMNVNYQNRQTNLRGKTQVK